MWKHGILATLIVVSVLSGVAGFVFLPGLLHDPPPEPQWREVLYISAPTPEGIHHINITGDTWRIFAVGLSNESSSILAIGLFAVYPNGSSYDIIPLDLFILQDFHPFDFVTSNQRGPGEYQVFVLVEKLDFYAVIVTEFA